MSTLNKRLTKLPPNYPPQLCQMEITDDQLTFQGVTFQNITTLSHLSFNLFNCQPLNYVLVEYGTFDR